MPALPLNWDQCAKQRAATEGRPYNLNNNLDYIRPTAVESSASIPPLLLTPPRMEDLMEAQAQATAPRRNAQAVDVLRKLNDIGAINLDVLVSKASEIKTIAGGGASAASELDPEDRICYKFYIKVGPRDEIDLVSVAAELKGLGFEVKRVATK